MSEKLRGVVYRILFSPGSRRNLLPPICTRICFGIGFNIQADRDFLSSCNCLEKIAIIDDPFVLHFKSAI